jgi:hypothetical protein
MSRTKLPPEVDAQYQILKIIGRLPQTRALAVLRFVADQLESAIKYDLPVEPQQANIGQQLFGEEDGKQA